MCAVLHMLHLHTTAASYNPVVLRPVGLRLVWRGASVDVHFEQKQKQLLLVSHKSLQLMSTLLVSCPVWDLLEGCISVDLLQQTLLLLLLLASHKLLQLMSTLPVLRLA